MSNKQVYVDKISPEIPEWYALVKYQDDLSLRDNYINNALNPYQKENTFYSLSDSIKRQQLMDAAIMEKARAKAMKEKQNKINRSTWRDKIKFIL